MQFSFDMVFHAIFVFRPTVRTMVHRCRVVGTSRQANITVSWHRIFGKRLTRRRQVIFCTTGVQVFGTTGMKRNRTYGDIVLARRNWQRFNFHANNGKFRVPFTFFSPTRAGQAIQRCRFAYNVGYCNFPLQVITFTRSVRRIEYTSRTPKGMTAVITELRRCRRQRITMTTTMISGMITKVVRVGLFWGRVTRYRHRNTVDTLFQYRPLITRFNRFEMIENGNSNFDTFMTCFNGRINIQHAYLQCIEPPNSSMTKIVPINEFQCINLLTPNRQQNKQRITVPIMRTWANTTGR